MLMHWQDASTIALGGTGGIYRGRGPLQNNWLTHAIPEQSKLTQCTFTSLETAPEETPGAPFAFKD